MTSLRTTLAHPGLWTGLAGSALMWAGSVAQPFVPNNYAALPVLHQLHARLTSATGGIVLTLGALLLTAAFLLVRPPLGSDRPRPAGGAAAPGATLAPAPGPNLWLVFAAWLLPILVSAPLLSRDVYLYIEQGWLLATGHNPYAVPLGTVPGPFVTFTDEVWRGTTAVYPPLTLVAQAAAVALGGSRVLPAMLLMRLPALIGAVMMGLCVAAIARRLGRDPRRALWLALLNPVTVLHLIGGGHNDGLMIGFVLLGCLLAYRRLGLLWGALCVGVAAGFKQTGILSVALITMIAVPAGSWLRRIGAGALAGLIALVTFVGLGASTGLGLGWIKALGVPGSSPSLAFASEARFVISLLIHIQPQRTLLYAGYAAFAATAGWAVLRHWRRPYLAMAAVYFALGLFGPNTYPWYLVLPLALAALTPMSRLARGLVVGLVVYITFGNQIISAFWMYDFLLAGLFGAVAALLVMPLILWPADVAATARRRFPWLFARLPADEATADPAPALARVGVGATLREPGFWLGLVGAAIAAVSPVLGHVKAFYGNAPMLVAILLIAGGYLLTRRTGGSRVHPWLTFAAWTLPIVLAPASLDPELAVLARHRAVPDYAVAIAARALATAAVVVGMLLVERVGRRLGRSPEKLLWLGLLNPLTIFITIGGGHREAVAAALVALALWLPARAWWQVLLAGAVVGLAGAVAPVALWALVPVALPGAVTWGERIWRAGVAGVGALLLLAPGSIALRGSLSGLKPSFGWTLAVPPNARLFLGALFNINVGRTLSLAFLALYAVAAVAVVLLLARRPREAMVIGIGAVQLLWAGQQAWYLAPAVLALGLAAWPSDRRGTWRVVLGFGTFYLVATCLPQRLHMVDPLATFQLALFAALLAIVVDRQWPQLVAMARRERTLLGHRVRGQLGRAS